MTPGSSRLSTAVRHLKRSDPVLAGLIRAVGPCRFAVRPSGTHLEALLRSIVYQQLSGHAARTIHERVLSELGEVTPRRILDVDRERLSSAGLSRQKIEYLRDLAHRANSGVLDVENLHELEDDELITVVSSVKGIGRWTAQMFLMFRLGRLDVLPELDLGVRKAVHRAYRLRKLPSAERLKRIGAPWSPYRSVAAWYLWRSLDASAG